MTARWLRTVRTAGEPGRVSLQEVEGEGAGAIVCREIVMTAEVGSHIGFELARLSVELLKKERTS